MEDKLKKIKDGLNKKKEQEMKKIKPITPISTFKKPIINSIKHINAVEEFVQSVYIIIISRKIVIKSYQIKKQIL